MLCEAALKGNTPCPPTHARTHSPGHCTACSLNRSNRVECERVTKPIRYETEAVAVAAAATRRPKWEQQQEEERPGVGLSPASQSPSVTDRCLSLSHPVDQSRSQTTLSIHSVGLSEWATGEIEGFLPAMQGHGDTGGHVINELRSGSLDSRLSEKIKFWSDAGRVVEMRFAALSDTFQDHQLATACPPVTVTMNDIGFVHPPAVCRQTDFVEVRERIMTSISAVFSCTQAASMTQTVDRVETAVTLRKLKY